MYCVMRASVPSLYNVYRRYDIAVERISIPSDDVTASGAPPTFSVGSGGVARNESGVKVQGKVESITRGVVTLRGVLCGISGAGRAGYDAHGGWEGGGGGARKALEGLTASAAQDNLVYTYRESGRLFLTRRVNGYENVDGI